MTITYNKTLTPPEAPYFAETEDGLKYWIVNHQPCVGNQVSLYTEDENISMHIYSGGRDYGSTFLMRYQGFNIGFWCHDPNSDGDNDLPIIYDDKDNSATYTITDIGVPVLTTMASGHSELITPLTNADYRLGKREYFKTREQQELILKLLPDFFVAIRGGLKVKGGHEYPNSKIKKVKFTKELEDKIMNGDLVK